MNEMKLSCGFLIRDRKTKKFLGCLPTGTRKAEKNCYDIPKGCIEDERENYIDCALRELKEETGLVQSDLYNISRWGLLKYLKWKNLYLFYAEADIDLNKLKCTSMFVDKDGKEKPEMSSFTLGDMSIFRPKLREAIGRFIKY